MTFQIPAHGVPIAEDGLSPAQRTLTLSDAPIRICGAPTGAGKTYTFLRAAQKGQFVIFVVPTQALARDVEREAARKSISHFRWDAVQSRTLREQGISVWDERAGEVDRLASGGILITTPESLALVLHGEPAYSRVPLTVERLAQADHIVFDEIHTLTERGFGFLSFWMTLVAYRALHHRQPKPKLTLLSATPSNLWEAWLRHLDPSVRDLVQLIDEELAAVSSGSIRWLHGDVTVTLEDRSVLELLTRHVPAMKDGRILVLYDSLRELAGDLALIGDRLPELGLSRDEVYVVDGQDRQLEHTPDSARFRSGLNPGPEHRLLIGTSAIEMGVNYPDIRYAVLAPGPDAAALLQRIGRVARGRIDGQIWISSQASHGFYTVGHVERLTRLSGRQHISALRAYLAPWREISLDRAYALGGAYWSFLENKVPGRLREFLGPAFDALSAENATRPSSLLNLVRMKIHGTNSYHRRTLTQWLNAIDRELRSLRDFAPTVLVQFGDEPPFEYSRDWLEHWIDLSHLVIGADGTWRLPGSRDQCLLERPRPVTRFAFHPFGDSVLIRKGAMFSAPVEQLLQREPVLISPEDKEIWKLIKRFIRQTGLLAYETPGDAAGDSQVF